jgi:hypothetical protein
MNQEDEIAISFVAVLALVTFGRQKNLMDGTLEPYTVKEALTTVKAARDAIHKEHYPGGRK